MASKDEVNITITKYGKAVIKHILSETYRCLDEYGVVNTDHLDLPQLDGCEKNILHNFLYGKKIQKRLDKNKHQIMEVG